MGTGCSRRCPRDQTSLSGVTSGHPSNPGQGSRKLEDWWTPGVSSAISPGKPVYMDRTLLSFLGVLLGPIEEQQSVGVTTYPLSLSSSSGSC